MESEPKTFIESTAKITPEYRAQAAADSIDPGIEKRYNSGWIFGRQSWVFFGNE
jgi:hypothetical protein